MGTPNNQLFPDNIAAVVGNLAAPGTNTDSIFEYREAVIRALGAYSFLAVFRQSSQPSSPAAWDFWINPGTLSGASINSADIKVYDGTVWQNVTPALFAKAIINKAAGSGGWKEATTGLIQSPSNKTYTICLKLPFPGLITFLAVQTVSGSCTVDLNVNGASIQQLAAGTGYNSATPSVAVNLNDKITLTVSANSSAVDLSFEFQMART